MPNIQIKDVPEDVHAVLRRRAAEHGQSLQEYLLGFLTVHARRPTLEEVLKRVDQHTGGDITVEEAVRWVREGRDER